jgi:FkbM family methyltransferase
MEFLKTAASRLPLSWQQELRRQRFRRQIRSGRFGTLMPEYHMLASLLGPGDWAIDVGANIGHYTKRMSDLVGAEGRVIALEPVPDSFALLTSNATLFQHDNVTLVNAAASERTQVVGFSVPRFASGLVNYYEAAITPGASDLRVLTLSLDSLAIPQRVRLIKIDAEGHDAQVLRGAEQLLRRDHPVLIVEAPAQLVGEYLEGFGYAGERAEGAPNTIWR